MIFWERGKREGMIRGKMLVGSGKIEDKMEKLKVNEVF
jgi:hypothetical protein